jgi:hypothetical protein
VEVAIVRECCANRGDVGHIRTALQSARVSAGVSMKNRVRLGSDVLSQFITTVDIRAKKLIAVEK